MKAHNWYVLSGGPSSGKSTLIQELSRRGYFTVDEAARVYAEQHIKKGASIKELRRNEQLFQENVFKQKLLDHTISKETISFFDRGYHDTIAYLKIFGQKIESSIQKTCKEFMYSKVFLLDMLPYDTTDKIRIEEEKVAHQIHNELRSTYLNYGHEVIDVPVLPISNRADFVLQHIVESDTLSS